MYAVGIDVSKGKSMVAIASPGGKLYCKPFVVNHKPSELNKLATLLKSLGSETKAVMEHTGRYYEPVANYLYNENLFVSAVNPLLISKYDNDSIRHVKTDKEDAIKIANFGLDKWCKLRQYSSMDAIRYQLKTLHRQFCLYTKTQTALKNNYIALLDQTFPGVNELFSSPVREDGSQKWVDFAAKFWHIDCVTGISEEAFTEEYRNFCKENRYNYCESKAHEIFMLAQDSISLIPSDETTHFLLQQAYTSLQGNIKATEALRAKMYEVASMLPEFNVVMDMGGVGKSLGPQLMAELGDVTRFASRGSIVAYAGVDPGKNDSGDVTHKSGKCSKCGSPELRRTLFILMDGLIQRQPEDDPVYRFMDKKRAEGKPYYVYMTAGANKFLRIYYARVKEFMAKYNAEKEPAETSD